MDRTRQVIAEMLKENTGAHMLDSGGAYGRNHEQNQSREFEAEPASTVTFKWGIEYTKNVYHFLTDVLSYDSGLNGYLDRFIKQDEKEDSWDQKSWCAIREEFPEYLNTRKRYKNLVEPQGTYNSYNGEDALSQVILYTLFSIDDEYNQFVALQIHGGCDVRGGYTRPRIFALTEEWSIAENARGDIICTGDRDHNWYTDDAYHWYANGTTGYHAGRQLEAYPIIDTDDLLFAVDANTDNLDDYLTDTVADIVLQTSLAECIREYQNRYNAASLEPKTKYTDEDYQITLDILIYKRLIQVNEEYLETTIPLDMIGGKGKIEMLESEMIPYQRIIDRKERRKAELNTTTWFMREYTTRQTTTKIMKKQQAKRRQAIGDLKFERQQYHESRSFILAQDDSGLCPLCQSPLDCY